MRFRAPSIFYGWYIVGAGLVINMLMGGLVMHAFGFYAAALKDELPGRRPFSASRLR